MADEQVTDTFTHCCC